MARNAIVSGVLVVSAAVGLAACSSGTPHPAAARSSTPGSPSATPSTQVPLQAGSDPGNSFCSLLSGEQTKAAQLSAEISQSIASGNVTTVKQALGTILATIAQELKTVESKMTSAPADVQAAIATVNSFFTQANTAIANATSLADVGTALAGQNTQQLETASTTLAQYAESQCGTPLSAPS